VAAAGGATAASTSATASDSSAAKNSATDADTPKAQPKAEKAPAPAAPADTSAPADAAAPEPVQPKGLDAPMGDEDDLKRISGVGPVLEGKLNGLGFYHFWQISRWTRAEVDWVDGYLSFKGRIDRDNWIDQATKLAEDSPSKPPA
jgi:NADH-quinone oxidoreductase subunit E